MGGGAQNFAFLTTQSTASSLSIPPNVLTELASYDVTVTVSLGSNPGGYFTVTLNVLPCNIEVLLLGGAVLPAEVPVGVTLQGSLINLSGASRQVNYQWTCFNPIQNVACVKLVGVTVVPISASMTPIIVSNSSFSPPSSSSVTEQRNLPPNSSTAAQHPRL